MDAEKRYWQAQYDAAASRFTEDYQVGRWVSRRFYGMAQQRIRRVLAPYRGQPLTVLDVCCGAGAFLETFDAWGFDATGTDLSVGALGHLKHTASRKHQRVAAADAGVLPFPDGSFDLVVSIGMLQCVTDLPAYFRELARVARPNAALLLLFSPDCWLVRRRHRRVLPTHPDMAHYRLHAVEAVADALVGAGFAELDVSYLYYVFYAPPLIPLLGMLNRFPALCRKPAALATSAVILAKQGRFGGPRV